MSSFFPFSFLFFIYIFQNTVQKKRTSPIFFLLLNRLRLAGSLLLLELGGAAGGLDGGDEDKLDEPCGDEEGGAVGVLEVVLAGDEAHAPLLVLEGDGEGPCDNAEGEGEEVEDPEGQVVNKGGLEEVLVGAEVEHEELKDAGDDGDAGARVHALLEEGAAEAVCLCVGTVSILEGPERDPVVAVVFVLNEVATKTDGGEDDHGDQQEDLKNNDESSGHDSFLLFIFYSLFWKRMWTFQ